jgi:hypothetical protein
MTVDMFNLIPDDYVVASGGSFIKLPGDGQSIKVFLVGPCDIGYSYWTNDKKCIRSKTKFTATPDIRVGDDGKVDSVKQFMVFRVFQYDDAGVRTEGLLEITQLSIKADIVRIYRDKDFRDEVDGQFWHSFKISTAGKGLKTKYKVDAFNMRRDNRPTIDEMTELMTKYDLAKILYTVSTATPDVAEDLTSGAGANGSF